MLDMDPLTSCKARDCFIQAQFTSATEDDRTWRSVCEQPLSEMSPRGWGLMGLYAAVARQPQPCQRQHGCEPRCW